MKILYWTPRFLPDIGGIPVLAMHKLSILHARGDGILVLASHSTSDPSFGTDFGGIPVYRLPFWAALANRDLRLMLQVQRECARLIDDFKPDLIHIDFSGYTAYFQLASRNESTIPMLVSLHSCFAGQPSGEDTTVARLLRKADWIVAASHAVLTDATQLLPEIESKASVIYYGLEPPDVAPLPLPLDPMRILCVGRLHREKGFDLVIQAFVNLVSRYPSLRLTIVGGGPERAVLEELASSLGLSQSIEFVGEVSNNLIVQWMNGATVVVLPSRVREAFPVVALEAASMARPVVASNVGGLAESVADGKTGLLVEMENVEALTNAIAYLLDHSEAAREMGAAARSRTLELYSLDRFTQAYDELYHRLIRQSKVTLDSWNKQSPQPVTSSV